MNKELSIPRLETVVYIRVCCFTALVFANIHTFSPEHLVLDNSEFLWICKNRQKTSHIYNIPVLNIATVL